MKERTLHLLLIALIFAPSIVFATEPFEFISDVIRSLDICKIAESRIKETDQQDMYSLMKDIRVFTNEIHHANSIIERHAKSKNDLIRESARGYSNIYSAIVANNEQLLRFIEEKLNNPVDAVSKQGTWLRRESEIGAINEELWRNLIDVTILSDYTMIDMNRIVADKFRFLTITTAERDSLKSELRDKFGNDVTIGLQAGQYPIDASAASLWEVLAGSWKPSDSK